MSLLDDYNKKTQESYERLKTGPKKLISRASFYEYPSGKRWEEDYSKENQKKLLDAFNEIRDYFISDECNWQDMPKHHPDIKFVNHLRRHCKTLKDIKIATDDRNALELISEDRVALEWLVVSEARRLVNTSWAGDLLSDDDVGKIYRLMANRLLQDVFIKPKISEVNFPKLETSNNDSKSRYRSWTGSSNTSISSVGKHKCHLCGKPAIFDTNVCKECNPK